MNPKIEKLDAALNLVIVSHSDALNRTGSFKGEQERLKKVNELTTAIEACWKQKIAELEIDKTDETMRAELTEIQKRYQQRMASIVFASKDPGDQ